ncbi:UNVERIFIED_CONTAM: hypothetical protein FKN15_019918 [Acipenser sinensis]
MKPITLFLQCHAYDFEYGTECLQLVLQICGSQAKLIEGHPLSGRYGLMYF